MIKKNYGITTCYWFFWFNAKKVKFFLPDLSLKVVLACSNYIRLDEKEKKGEIKRE